jgi:hypothetical protein
MSAFLIELLDRLEQDPMDIIQDVLIYQTQMMRNSSLGPYVPADFSPPEYIVVVNALFYASLGVMLLTAFIAMLIKSWVHEFDRGLRGMSIPEQRAKTREFRYLGMERWKLPEMVGILPSLIQISLLLFSIGLLLFLFYISKPSFGVTTAIFGVGVFYYAITTSISVFATSSPFHSPLSRTLATVYQQVHAYLFTFIGTVAEFLIDQFPGTSLDHFCHCLLIPIHYSRPYSEGNLVKPIGVGTEDEIQHSTAVSALQRIHDNAPDSHHSETLQSSVWQVAGSATFPIPPSFHLPSWISDRENDEEYFSHLRRDKLVALVAVSLRVRRRRDTRYVTTARNVLQRMGNSKDIWAQLVIAVFDCVHMSPYTCDSVRSNNLTNIIQREELQPDESLWLLRTLSELCSEGRLPLRGVLVIETCLQVLLNQAPKWGYSSHPVTALLESVVTLAAMSCLPGAANRRKIFTNSRQRPWLPPNIRTPNLISTLFEGTPSDYHKQLISLLFLVVYGLMTEDNYTLTRHYFTITTERGGLTLCTSALTAVAPVMRGTELSIIVGSLVGYWEPIYRQRTGTMEELLKCYDHTLGTNQDPDPNILAILLILSKSLPSFYFVRIEKRAPELKNSWMRLVARVVTQLDIPDGSGLPVGLFCDHRVNNMIAASSLLRYTKGRFNQNTESLLLASFLPSQEFAISSVALEYYMKTMSYSDPSAPPCYLSAAVSAVSNCMLPDHQLLIGWRILDIFMDQFETLSVEWQRTFAESFFILSRRPLPRPRGDMESSTQENELEKILTWEYFHEEQTKELTDSDFSGLDWMAMAWSLHLSQHSVKRRGSPGQGKVLSRGLGGPTLTEESVLKVLCKLLDAAPYHRIVPIIPKIWELVQWFGDTEFPEYRQMISTQIREAVRMQQEFQMLHKFHKFHCMWYS